MLGTSLVALGSVAVLGAAVLIVGPVGVAITALAAAMVAFTAINWEAVSSAASKVGEFASIVGGGLAKLGAIVAGFAVDAFVAGLTKISDGIGKIPAAIEALAALPAKAEQAVADLAGKLSSAIESIPAQCMAAISGMASSLGSAIAGAVKSAFGFGAGAAPGAPAHSGQPQHPGSPTSGPYQYRQSYAAPPSGAASQQTASYGGRGKDDVHLHVKAVAMLDSKVLGESMSSMLAQLSTFPRQAAYADPFVAWNAPDNNALA